MAKSDICNELECISQATALGNPHKTWPYSLQRISAFLSKSPINICSQNLAKVANMSFPHKLSLLKETVESKCWLKYPIDNIGGKGVACHSERLT